MSKHRNLPKHSDPRGGHVRLYWEILDSPAWSCLSASDQRAYLALQRQLRSTNNGDLSLPLSVARHFGITSPATLAKSLRALVAVGLLAVTRKGGCTKGGQRLPSLYRFTDHEAYENPMKNIEASKPTNEWKSLKNQAIGLAKIRQAEDLAAEIAGSKKKSLLQKLIVTTSINEVVEALTTSIIEVWPPLPTSIIEAGETSKTGIKPNTDNGLEKNSEFSKSENHTSKIEVLSTVTTPISEFGGSAVLPAGCLESCIAVPLAHLAHRRQATCIADHDWSDVAPRPTGKSAFRLSRRPVPFWY